MCDFLIAIVVTIFSLSFFGSCQSPMCVGEGTSIATPNGPKLVERVCVGDVVLSPDPVTKRMYRGRVTSIVTARRKCLVLSLSDGRMLRVTPEHPLWDPAEKRFKTAGEFVAHEAHEVVSCVDASLRKFHPTHVDGIAAQTVTSRVYNLTIESAPHTFIANGVVVHNKPPAPIPPPQPVTDLRVDSVDDTTALAIWTEPGPSSAVLSRAQFFLDTVAITDSALDLSMEITVDLGATTGGAVDSAMLSGLRPSTTYHVRVRVFGHGFSELSNSVSFTTGP